MPNLNFSDSVFIGTTTQSGTQSSMIIEDDLQTIIWNGDFVNTDEYIYPIRLYNGLIQYTMSSSDCILIMSYFSAKGGTNLVNLGTHPNGKTFYFRSVGESDVTVIGPSGGVVTARVAIRASGTDNIRPSWSRDTFTQIVVGTTYSANPSAAIGLTYYNGTWFMIRNEDSTGLSV